MKTIRDIVKKNIESRVWLSAEASAAKSIHRSVSDSTSYSTEDFLKRSVWNSTEDFVKNFVWIFVCVSIDPKSKDLINENN